MKPIGLIFESYGAAKQWLRDNDVDSFKPTQSIATKGDRTYILMYDRPEKYYGLELSELQLISGSQEMYELLRCRVRP